LKSYALLVHPGSNRVYAQQAPALGASELAICMPSARAIEATSIAGRDYLTFSSDEPVDAVARLSVAFALFERVGDAFVPVALPSADRYDDDLITIQRYTGKTNESFTKMLVNITVPSPDKITLLDPMAGRGTTLHQAVLYGWDAVGVEIDKKDCEAYRLFFTTWLKNKRMPHKARNDKHKFSVSFGADRAALDAAPQTVTMTNGDSRYLDGLVKKNSVDAIVCDLPYGVRHGSEGGQRQRSARSLVEESVDAWHKVLRPGGAVGLAFNTFTCTREDLVAALRDFDVLDDAPYLQLAHRVDQSINRDVVIARRR
jgi:hypothetical protein